RKTLVSGNALFTRFGAAAILVSRGVPVLAESVCFVCGYNRMPLRTYLVCNLVGSLPVVFIHAICGRIGVERGMFLVTFGISLALLAGFWVLGQRLLPVPAREPKTTTVPDGSCYAEKSTSRRDQPFSS